MIISHQYKFIFIKTIKTAGTSIEVFLSQVCGPNDILTPIYPHVDPHVARNYEGFYNHMPGPQIRDRVGREVWDNYFKFCVERNPWDKTISAWNMASFRSEQPIPLDLFLNSGEFPVDYPKYTEPGKKDEIIVDRVAYYESLLDELGEIFARLGIPFQGTLGVSAKSEYRTDRRPYQDLLNKQQADIISQKFSHEIAIHGYFFDQMSREIS